MLRSALTLTALLLLAPSGAAQFSTFTWTPVNPGGFVMLSGGGTTLGVGGGSGGAAGMASWQAVAPVDAYVTAVGTTIATPKGGCGDSHGVYGEGGATNVLPDCSTAVPLGFSVHAGATMVFGLQVVDTTLPGDVHYAQFGFRPYWGTLGGALPGAAGAPVLAGAGVLEPGETVHLTLGSAAPLAPAVLVLGAGSANLPFKGGVMVPAPDILVQGLATDAAGALALSGPWPPGLPSGFAFVTQVWVADAGAPLAWAASNALLAVAY